MNTTQSVQKEEWRDTLTDLLQSLLDIVDEEHWKDDVNEIFKFVDRISASVREETMKECLEVVEGMRKEVIRDGNWGHTYGQGCKDGEETALEQAIAGLEALTND